ncbi:BTAD domain-containing putative transcriptional regulator [Paractinoplanes rishiriensis]|nr:BTAD domain-containing putative transcriptional regulator [Actinoplanes rishiriensis]
MIRARRQAAGWDQESLARAAGVSVRTVRNIELGRVRSPLHESVRRLVGALPGGASAASSRLHIEVLGPVLVRRGPHPVDLRSRRLRDLIGLLVIRAPHPVGRDEIVDGLWDGAPPPSSHTLVNTYVARLRAEIGPGAPLLRTVSGYRLDVEPDQVDLAVFNDLFDRGLDAAGDADHRRAAILLTQALDCWRGPLLADAGPGLARHPVAVAAAARRVAAACAYADAGLAIGNFAEVASRLRPLAERESFHEGLHARLMLAVAGTGEQASALGLYAGLRERLADELGISPGQAVHDAYLSVLRQKSAVVGWPVAQLPGGTALLVGRDAELRRLNGLEGGAGPVVCVLTGQAGVGKTTLAVAWGRQASERFPDGQLYVDLQGFDPAGTPVDPADAIHDFLLALGAGSEAIPSTRSARTALYRSLTAGRRLLIILDNARGTDQVRPLLPGGAGSFVVVTSRDKMTGLVAQGAHSVVVGPLAEDAAMALLSHHLGAQRLGREPAAGRDIVQRCARLPLPLAVAAARAAANPGFSLASVAAELHDDRRGLDPYDSGDEATSVRNALSWSYHGLESDHARVFRLLGIVPNPEITAPAAASLAGLPPPRAAAALTALARVHLVDEVHPGRYSLHDLLRSYARELVTAVDTAADRDVALDRITGHYVVAAQRAARLVAPNRAGTGRVTAGHGEFRSAEQAVRWYDTERATLLATIRQAAADGRDASVCDLAHALTELFDRRGHWHDWVAVTDLAAVAAARLADPIRAARLHRSRARAEVWLGHYDRAQDQLAQALDRCRDTGDQAERAHIFRCLAWCMGRAGARHQAVAHARTAIRLYARAGDVAGKGIGLNNLGWQYAHLGRPEIALRCCHGAVALLRAAGDDNGAGHAHDSLGFIYQQLGDRVRAVDHYVRSVALLRRTGDVFHEGDTLIRLGDARLAAGDKAGAMRAWRRAFMLLARLRHPSSEEARSRLNMRPGGGPGR